MEGDEMNIPVSCRPEYMDPIISAAWSGETGEELREHLSGCPACRAVLDAELELFRKAGGVALEVGDNVREGLAEEIFARTTRREKTSFAWKFPAAVMAGAVAASLFFYTKKTEVEIPEESVSFAEVDMEVLENMELLEQMEMLEVLDALENLGDT
jgi:hypothetical protein